MTLLRKHFNPRSPCGERRNGDIDDKRYQKFQSTLPVWGATIHPFPTAMFTCYFNPRSPCGERRLDVEAFARLQEISIHAPRVGSDDKVSIFWYFITISIHAPRVGSDYITLGIKIPLCTFQSTLPVWGATVTQPRDYAELRFQSTLPVWGATPLRGQFTLITQISIHAPRVGSDQVQAVSCRLVIISIHAPRVGSDSRKKNWLPPNYDFNPRSPCGERLSHISTVIHDTLFQSTLPVWGATNSARVTFPGIFISIHAPRVGSDDQ